MDDLPFVCPRLYQPGRAYVFVKPAGGWSGSLTQNATLNPPDLRGTIEFGNSVAIDGDTIVVGALAATAGASDRGQAYVFVKPGRRLERGPARRTPG